MTVNNIAMTEHRRIKVTGIDPSCEFDDYCVCKGPCVVFMSSTNGQIYMSRTIPAPTFLGIL